MPACLFVLIYDVWDVWNRALIRGHKDKGRGNYAWRKYCAWKETVIREIKGEELKRASCMFAGWEDTMIWSCLEGQMGRVYAACSPRISANRSEGEEPSKYLSAKAKLGAFRFLAGEANEELLSYGEEERKQEEGIFVPQDERWEAAIESVYRGRAVRGERYAFKKKAESFSLEKLEKAAGAVKKQGGGFSVSGLDRRSFEEASRLEWAADWVSQFGGYEEYEKRGIGVVIRFKDELVAGASSYTVYSGGIEVQIDTREDYRGRGLGEICGAELILRCLKRGLYPSWDADNETSARLARRLGYEDAGAYTVYRVKMGKGEEHEKI